MPKETQARIKINKLLETAGWRFFDDERGKANIALEPNVKLTQTQVDAMGKDFETSGKGFIDFLLLDEQGFPLLVLEAKAEDKNPLIGIEQARKYAKSQNCRFVSATPVEAREYEDPADQIRELLVHKNYFSLKEIEACMTFDVETMRKESQFAQITVLFDQFSALYSSESTA